MCLCECVCLSVCVTAILCVCVIVCVSHHCAVCASRATHDPTHMFCLAAIQPARVQAQDQQHSQLLWCRSTQAVRHAGVAELWCGLIAVLKQSSRNEVHFDLRPAAGPCRVRKLAQHCSMRPLVGDATDDQVACDRSSQGSACRMPSSGVPQPPLSSPMIAGFQKSGGRGVITIQICGEHDYSPVSVSHPFFSRKP